MNLTSKLIIISFIFFSFSKEETHSLTVKVNDLRNSEGVVMFLLYNKEGDIPDKDMSKYYKKITIPIVSNNASVTFTNIPNDTYAVNIIHDENNNGKIDMGFFKPKEGIGFSNFNKINIKNRPCFSKASFDVKTDTSIDVKTIYM